MTGLEVSTAVQYGAKSKIVVFNDSALGSLGFTRRLGLEGLLMNW